MFKIVNKNLSFSSAERSKEIGMQFLEAVSERRTGEEKLLIINEVIIMNLDECGARCDGRLTLDRKFTSMMVGRQTTTEVSDNHNELIAS